MHHSEKIACDSYRLGMSPFLDFANFAKKRKFLVQIRFRDPDGERGFR